MKKFLGISVITASLLVGSVMGATDTPPQIPVTAEVKKDEKTNKAKDIEYKIDLVKGWNLISLAGYKPYILKDFFGKKELVDKIFVYNSAIQNWQSFVNEGDEQSVQTMVPGMGYWVNAKIPFSISFKSNIPAQRGVYEKAAVNVPTDLEAAAANTSDEMPPSIPVMVNSAGGYGDAFGDDGKVTEDFLKKSGTADWDNLDANEYSEADWDVEFAFDIDLLDGSEYTDQANRKYQFSPLNEKGGKVIIIDGDKTINAKFNITRKGELEIDLKKKSDNAGGQPEAAARVVGAEPVKDGEVGLTAIKDKLEDVKDVAVTAINEMAKKLPALTFELVEVEESDEGVVLKLKNTASKKPTKWKLTSFYDDVDGVWEDATAYFAEDVVDDELAGVDWDNIEDDSDLDALLDDEDIEDYDDEDYDDEDYDDEDDDTEDDV